MYGASVEDARFLMSRPFSAVGSAFTTATGVLSSQEDVAGYAATQDHFTSGGIILTHPVHKKLSDQHLIYKSVDGLPGKKLIKQKRLVIKKNALQQS